MVFMLLVLSGLSGIKSLFGIDGWKGRKISFLRIWKRKWLCRCAGIWLLGYGLLWIGNGKSLFTIRIASLLCTYMILAVVDGKRNIVPDEILVCYFAEQMLLGAVGTAWTELWHIGCSGAVFTVGLWICSWLTRGKMGFGDIKLLGVTAITAGWMYAVQTLVLAMALSFIYSMGLLFIGRKSIQTEFPFVPFLAMGTGLQLMILYFGGG